MAIIKNSHNCVDCVCKHDAFSRLAKEELINNLNEFLEIIRGLE